MAELQWQPGRDPAVFNTHPPAQHPAKELESGILPSPCLLPKLELANEV